MVEAGRDHAGLGAQQPPVAHAVADTALAVAEVPDHGHRIAARVLQLAPGNRIRGRILVDPANRRVTGRRRDILELVEKPRQLFVPEVTPTNPTKYAVMKCLDRKLVSVGDTVVCVLKRFCPLDTIYIVPVEESLQADLSFLREVGMEVLETVLRIAVELGREGKEGLPVGTAFIVGDPKNVLKNSHQMILNPFKGHPRSSRNVLNLDIKEVVTLIRTNVTLHYLKVFPNKQRRVLIFVSTGNPEIASLAERVKYLSGSKSDLKYIPYDEAYEGGFEDMERRCPDN